MAIKTKQQIDAERKRRMAAGLNSAMPSQQSNVPSMGPQGTAQLQATPAPVPKAIPYKPSQPLEVAPTAVPDISKIGAPAPVAPVKPAVAPVAAGLANATPVQAAPVAPPVKPAVAPSLDAEYKRINAVADQQNAGGPLPSVVGTGPAAPAGTIKTDTGLMTADSLKNRIESRNVAPDLTNQLINAGAKPGDSSPIPNQRFNSAVARTAAAGQVTNATPMGAMSAPLNTNANFSASAPAGVVETHQQRADRETNQAVQAIGGTRSLQSAAGQGMTHEAQAARARQLEQDKINTGLASAAQDQAKQKMEMELQGKVQPAQAQAMGRMTAAGLTAGRDIQGNLLPGANQAKQYTKGADGVYRDEAGGEPNSNVRQQLAAGAQADESIETARGLTPVKKSWKPWAKDNIYGYNPKTGEFVEFDSKEALGKDKQFIPLNPAQQKAFDEGNQGLASADGNNTAPAPAGQAQAGGMQTFGSVEEAEAAGLPKGTRVKIGGREAIIE